MKKSALVCIDIIAPSKFAFVKNTINHAIEFSRQDYEVTLLLYSFHVGHSESQFRNHYSIPINIKIVTFRQKVNSLVLYLFKLSSSRLFGNIIRFFLGYSFVPRSIQSSNFTIIYSRSLFTLKSLLDLFPDTPFVLETHSVIPHKCIFSLKDRPNFYLSTISEDLKQSYVRNGFDFCKIIVSPDCSFENTYFKPNFFKNYISSVNIIYLGKLCPEKGFYHLLDLALALKPFSNIFLSIAGATDDQYSYIKKFLGNNGITNCTVYPYLSSDDAASLLAKQDIGLLPYTRQTQSAMDLDTTSPMKLFEYLSAGLAIVSSDIPGVRDVIENNKNGFLSDVNDNISFTQSVLTLALNPDLISSMRRSNYALSRKYSYKVRIESILMRTLLANA